MKFKIIYFASLCFVFSNCSSVTIRDQDQFKIASIPQYSESQSFFFWGLAGNKFIDVDSICGTKKVVQMQAQDTFLDGFLTVITLGIYSPRTASVWCE